MHIIYKEQKNIISRIILKQILNLLKKERDRRFEKLNFKHFYSVRIGIICFQKFLKDSKNNIFHFYCIFNS